LKLEEIVRVIALSKADAIVVKDFDLVHALVNLRTRGLGRQIPIIHVNDFDDIKTLDESQMKELGWVRASR